MSKSQNIETRGSDNVNPNSETPFIKEDQMKLETLPISSLVVQYHPRNMLGDIESLQGSIKRDGLQEPLLVNEAADNQYTVIDGVRRLAAVQEFGWQSVPCLIKILNQDFNQPICMVIVCPVIKQHVRYQVYFFRYIISTFIPVNVFLREEISFNVLLLELYTACHDLITKFVPHTLAYFTLQQTGKFIDKNSS